MQVILTTINLKLLIQSKSIWNVWLSGTPQSADRTLVPLYATVELSATVEENFFIQTHFKLSPIGSASTVERSFDVMRKRNDLASYYGVLILS